RLGVSEDTPIQNRAVSKTLESAQKRVEGFNFDSRKNVVQYDNVINRHRRVVYLMRRKILEGDSIKQEITNLLDESAKVLTEVPAKINKKFVTDFCELFPISMAEAKKISTIKSDKAREEAAKKVIDKIYAAKEKEIGADIMRKIEREVYLQVLDTLWMQHLENMQHLREGIHWRSVGQRDPLVEYRSESQKLFTGLQNVLREEVIKLLLSVSKQEVKRLSDDEYETDLTKMAEGAVEKGVNEVTAGEANHDEDFKAKPKKSANESNRKKNIARKKKKTTRQNRKKGRK
ncbi:preprotein translocase subunit SecA, partial [Candidatus Saccharibacteria bacterium]|nr:preprotein translocase subunit SecA [Candidatus Saccharibacteria bacterium]